MKNYEQMAQSVFARIDEYNKAKQKRLRAVKSISGGDDNYVYKKAFSRIWTLSFLDAKNRKNGVDG